RACFPQQYNTAPPLDVTAGTTLNATNSVWRPGLRITPQVTEVRGTSDVTGLAVRLQDCANRTKRAMVVYCPAGADCSAPQIMSNSGGVFSYTFTFPFDGDYNTPVARGYIYVRNMDTKEETVTWYDFAGGVHPAGFDGHAALAEGAAETSREP